MTDDIPLWIPLAVVAPFIGSFLGVVILRLPEGRRVSWGRSRCDHCGHVLGPSDLVPIASWIFLRGRCRYCGRAIDPVCLISEVAALAVVLWAATVVSGGLLAAACLYGWLLLALAVIDARTLTLPDPLNVALAASGLAVAALFMPGQIRDHVAGAALGFGGFLLIARIYRAVRKREGLGRGDAKLLGAIGAWIAWEGLASVVLEAALIGLAAIAARRLFTGRPIDAASKVPFGSFLAAGGWLVWLYGPLVLS